MRVFIYAYDNMYGGLHGMYDYIFMTPIQKKKHKRQRLNFLVTL